MSAGANKGLTLSWKQIGKKNPMVPECWEAFPVCVTLLIYLSQRTRIWKPEFKFCVLLKSSLAMGQVNKVDNNPHLLGNYEVLLHPRIGNPDPTILVSFFSCVLAIPFLFSLFHFLSFDILFLDLRVMVGLRLCINVGFPERWPISPVVLTKCSLLSNQSCITTFLQGQLFMWYFGLSLLSLN